MPSADHIASFSQEVLGEVELCPACLEPVIPATTFCRWCQAPVSRYAAMLPFETIHAQAWIYGRAMTTTAPWRVHVLAPGLQAWTTLVFLVAFAFIDVTILATVDVEEAPSLVMIMLLFWIHIRAGENYRAHRDRPETEDDDEAAD